MVKTVKTIKDNTNREPSIQVSVVLEVTLFFYRVSSNNN